MKVKEVKAILKRVDPDAEVNILVSDRNNCEEIKDIKIDIGEKIIIKEV